ncbi:MAG: type II CAAX prenyl endopeptidase Rce1 family protein [Beutenbergiaceae bacterium]
MVAPFLLTSTDVPGWEIFAGHSAGGRSLCGTAGDPGNRLSAHALALADRHGVTFGEEVGWRGHLRTAWERWGFWRSALLIAAVRLLWHVPIQLTYYLQGTLTIRENLATWTSLVPLSILLCALVDRMRLVWVAVAAAVLVRRLGSRSRSARPTS